MMNKSDKDLCISVYSKPKLRSLIFNNLILNDLDYSGKDFGLNMEELGKHSLNAEKISNQRLIINTTFFSLVILPWILFNFLDLEVELAYVTGIMPQTGYVLVGLFIMLLVDFRFRNYIFNRITFPIRPRVVFLGKKYHFLV